MEVNKDEVKITFDTHPKVTELHISADGQTFFKRDEAVSHAVTRGLENKTPLTINRRAFFEELEAENAQNPAKQGSEDTGGTNNTGGAADKTGKESKTGETGSQDNGTGEENKAEDTDGEDKKPADVSKAEQPADGNKADQPAEDKKSDQPAPPAGTTKTTNKKK